MSWLLLTLIFSNVVIALSSANIDRAVAELINLWPSTTEARTHPLTSACVTYVGQNGTGSNISPSTLFFPCIILSVLNLSFAKH